MNRRLGGTAAVMLAATVIAGVLAGCGGHFAGAGGPVPASDHPRPQTYGRGALPAEGMRVVEIRMDDTLRFDPAMVTVHRGEVVTFHVVNAGKMLHEFTLGGQLAQDLHEAQMAEMAMTGGSVDPSMPGMPGMDQMKMPSTSAHRKYMKALSRRITDLDRTAAANESVHVPPGESRDLTWAFTGDQTPVYGCHVAQHWAAGMRGTIVFAGNTS